MKHDRTTKVLDAVVTISSISAAAVMANGFWEGYWIYLIANISGIALQYRVELKWSLARNVLFLCTTIYGINHTLL